MADDNWQKVREIFDSALRRKPEERRKFVNEVCGTDKILLAEVESLLSSLDSAGSFMEAPAVAKVADVIEAEIKRLETGKCFGHYEIIEQIGAGGMGEIYLANDKKLDRQVAVKILNEKFSQDESSLERFKQEAKAASALNHPNILVIHEIGESNDAHYIISEFVKGETLREILREKTLKLSEVLDISTQIAGALCAAHEARLIHRDIKPENVMIRPDGYVKILDFGLAKLIERKNKSILGLENSIVKQNQTAKGLILGTVNYMSPEQAKGERVDERTDIFSFGAVIYEMIAGRTPFAGDSVSETFANLINQEPLPLVRYAANVPEELSRIVSKMLKKNKTGRYQTMKDILTDLKNLRENLTVEEKLERAAAPPRLIVRQQFKQNESETSDSQTQIAEPANAYQAYQMARYHFQQISPTDSIKSRALLEEAVRFDADFAPAYAALAEQSVNEAITGRHTPAENFPKAKAALRRAAELDSSSAEFYAAAGFVDLVCDWNFAEAEHNLRKSLELNPYYAYANNYLGQVFMFQRRFDEAEIHLRRMREIEPMGLLHHHILTIAYFLARNYPKAIEECEKALAVYPRFYVAAWIRCWVLEQTGRASEAVAEYEKILREPHGELARRWIGYAYALVGDRENALETAACVVAESREHFVSQTHLAALYAALGEPDKACFYLENALAERDPWLLWIAADPRFDNLRGDSRFDALVNRVLSNPLSEDKEEHYRMPENVFANLKNVRENLTLDEKLEQSRSLANGNATAVLQTTTGDTNFQTAETNNGFSRQIKQSKSLTALILIIFLVGATALGYYFLAARNTAVGGKKSIAVLPLKPINTANRNELYEVGIADSLIIKLGAMKGFVVRPLSSTRKYADVGQDPIAAGKEQQVDYVLASNYQLAGGKIRVTAQLFNVANGQIEETYKSEKEASDVFAMQDAIAGEVGNILSARFVTTSNSPTAKRGTTNEEAYRLYLQGMYLYDKRTLADARKSVEVLDEAVRLDPNYALAWAGLAHAHRYAGNWGRAADIDEEYRKSIEAINQALALDANLSEAHSALCENKYLYEYDFAGAERECRRAVEADPNSSLAHEIYSRYLYCRGRPDEAIIEIKTAIALEPTSFFNQLNYGAALYYARRYEEAVAQYKRVIETEKNSGSTDFWLITTLALQGKEAEAFEWFMKSQTSQKASEETLQVFKTTYQTSGWQGVLREQLKRFDEGGNQSYYPGASLNAQIGNKDKAFEYLEKSFKRREVWMAYFQVDPRLDNLRGDPRFDELVRRVESK